MRLAMYPFASGADVRKNLDVMLRAMEQAAVRPSSSSRDVPWKRTWPVSSPRGVSSRLSMRSRVDLPLPVAPQITVKSPASTEKFTWCKEGAAH